MNINELKKGDKVWVRGSIDCDGDLMLGDALTYIKSSLIYNVDQKDIKLDGYDMSQAKESLKPEIPQFVADWIEEHKENYSRWDDGAKADFVFRAINDLFRFGEGRSLCCFDIDDELSKWTTENAFNFINAILFGYTVKKEKLYTVEIPDPNSPNVTTTLMRAINGVIIYFTINSDWVEQEGFQLTESEIRKDFDWAWQWAEEVTK